MERGSLWVSERTVTVLALIAWIARFIVSFAGPAKERHESFVDSEDNILQYLRMDYGQTRLSFFELR
jgi:hypothetical protein